MHSNFVCPLPWTSLSVGARNVPRVCCHSTSGDSVVVEGEKLLSLNHNSRIQEEMLLGKIPQECLGCYNLEQSSCRSPRLDYLERFSFDMKAKPIIKYLDITVDNDCNLECVMCSPAYSQRISTFATKSLNAAETSKWATSLSMQQLDQILASVEMITITGGEPFISAKSKQIIEHVTLHPRVSQITLRLFTNLTHLPQKLIEAIQKFKSVELILSIDSVGENYEFMRHPAKWSQVEKNLQWLCELGSPKLDLHVHSVLTAINWPHIDELISFYHQRINGYRAIPLFVAVETPIFLHPKVLPPSEFEAGKEKILHALNQLNPELQRHRDQIQDARNLIEVISKAQHSDRYLDYRIYLNKISGHRARGTNVHLG